MVGTVSYLTLQHGENSNIKITYNLADKHSFVEGQYNDVGKITWQYVRSIGARSRLT